MTCLFKRLSIPIVFLTVHLVTCSWAVSRESFCRAFTGADTGADAGFMAFYCPAQLSLSNRLSPEQGDTAELLGMAWWAAGAIKNTSKSDTREKSVSDKEQYSSNHLQNHSLMQVVLLPLQCTCCSFNLQQSTRSKFSVFDASIWTNWHPLSLTDLIL